MREIIKHQQALVETNFEHQHAKELEKISELLDESKKIMELVHADLIAGRKKPKIGRNGVSAELAIRLLIIKQMNNFSYEQLAFHLADSRTYRNFCRIGFADCPPKKSALQRAIKKLKPTTLESINIILIKIAVEKGIEKGRKVRIDCTETETNIHKPYDSSLLYDCVRVLSRIMMKAKDKLDVNGFNFIDHTKRAKRRRMGILNTRSEKKRETEFGHKIALTSGVSGLITDLKIEKGNPSDTSLAVKMVERQEDVFNRLPRQVAMDGGFASKDNVKEIKELGVKDVMFSRKRGIKIIDMVKSTWVYKRLRDFRAGIEGMISFLKRCFSLDRCNLSGFESFKSFAWSSVISANLLMIARHLLN
ncbi:MAG: transposase [Pseudomonadota bacterium]